jgi:hypothetical protein
VSQTAGEEAETHLSRLQGQQGIDEGLQGRHQEDPLQETDLERQKHPTGPDPALPGEHRQERHQSRSGLRGGAGGAQEDADGGLQSLSRDSRRLQRRDPEVLRGIRSRREDDSLSDGPRQIQEFAEQAERHLFESRKCPKWRFWFFKFGKICSSRV